MLAYGEQFGRFEILEELGRGGMAVVYRAVDSDTQQDVALKILYEQWMNDEEIVKRFIREAEVVSRLNHQNIVSIMDYGDVEGQLYLALAYMDGGTLSDKFVEPRAVSTKSTLGLLKQVARGLDYAHAQGIVHRDLKLQNVLLDKKNNVYITDFGIARLIDSTRLTATGYVAGTPAYMSPEQARGNPVDHRTDIYAYSVMAYLMLTGFYPFTADNPIAIIQKHMYESPPLPSHVNPHLPEAVDTVLLRGLEKDISNRYDSATDMMRALVKTLQEPEVLKTTTLVQTNVFNPIQSVPVTQVGTVGNIQAPVKHSAPTRVSSGNRTMLWGVFGVVMVAVLMTIIGMVSARSNEPILPTSAAAMLPTMDTTAIRLQFLTELTVTANYLASLPTATLTPSATFTATSSPTASPSPTQTPTLTPSQTITNTPPPSATAQTTPIEFLFPESDGQVRVVEGAFVYEGASDDMDTLGILPYRSLLTLLGRDALGNWVETESQQGFAGWMKTSDIDVYVDVLTLPITWDDSDAFVIDQATEPNSPAEPTPVVITEQIIVEVTSESGGSSNNNNGGSVVVVREPTDVPDSDELHAYFIYDSWLLEDPGIDCYILDDGLEAGWKFEAKLRPVDTRDWLYGYVFETNEWGWVETGDLSLTFDINDVPIDYDIESGCY